MTSTAKKDCPIFPPQYVLRALDKLAPYADNARTHSPEQVKRIAASIQEFGFNNPVLIDEGGEIIAGHGRVMAAQSLGLAQVPVLVLPYLSAAQKAAYRLADNKLAEHAGWDAGLLRLEFERLQGMDFDLSLTGFDLPEIGSIFDKTDPAKAGEEDAPELPAEPITVPGDIWVMGRHRLRCGDATVATDVEAVLAGVEPHLMVTDPPYGVEYDANWRNEADRANGKPYGASAIGKTLNDDRADWSEAWALFPGDVAYIWHAGRHASLVQSSLEAAEFEIRCQIIWAKHRFAISRGDYHWQHEPCWYAVRKGTTGHWSGDRSQTTLWNIEHNKSETGHSAQKPVECMRRPMVNNSSRGQAVYDPFIGSGTSIIAAETTNRVCYGIEIDPKYCDVAVQRWQNFTGKKAERL